MGWFAAAAIVVLVGLMLLMDIKQRRQLRQLTKRRDELKRKLKEMDQLREEQQQRKVLFQ